MTRPRETGKRLATGLAVFIMLLLTQPAAQADDLSNLERAKALFKKAEVHFKLGEFKQALPLYREAYRTKEIPAFLFNIGQCHRYLGNCDQANFFFRQYLAGNPDSPHAPKVKELMATCKSARPAEPVAPARPAGQPRPAEQAKPTAAVPAPVEEPAEGDDDTLRTVLIWGGAGLGAALLVTGAITGGMAYDRSQTFKDPGTPYEDLQGLEDSGKTLRAVAVASLAVGAAAVASSVLIYFLYPEAERDTTVSLAPLHSGGAIILGGRF